MFVHIFRLIINSYFVLFYLDSYLTWKNGFIWFVWYLCCEMDRLKILRYIMVSNFLIVYVICSIYMITIYTNLNRNNTV